MKPNGFTLIELMITVVIIAILAGIAYPSYVEQVKKARRTNAQADLVELSSFMERYYTENFTYMDGAGAPALPFDKSPKEGGEKYYNLSVSPTPTQNTFTLKADPIGSQSDDRCGSMTLDHTGSRTAVKADCWQ